MDRARSSSVSKGAFVRGGFQRDEAVVARAAGHGCVLGSFLDAHARGEHNFEAAVDGRQLQLGSGNEVEFLPQRLRYDHTTCRIDGLFSRQ